MNGGRNDAQYIYTERHALGEIGPRRQREKARAPKTRCSRISARQERKALLQYVEWRRGYELLADARVRNTWRGALVKAIKKIIRDETRPEKPLPSPARNRKSISLPLHFARQNSSLSLTGDGQYLSMESRGELYACIQTARGMKLVALDIARGLLPRRQRLRRPARARARLPFSRSRCVDSRRAPPFLGPDNRITPLW